MNRHVAAAHWSLPPSLRPLPAGLARVSLLSLAARPDRLDHRLVVVGRVGDAQIELATGTEPLYFAHRNVSDEYVVALPTGDPLVDALPYRVFLSDPATGEDSARIRHRAGDLILHPYGWLHWPGRLRPPFARLPTPPGGPRAAVSAVFCAGRLALPGERPVWVDAGREADVKAYREPAPPLLLDGLRGASRVVGSLAGVELSLARPPFEPARGGYVLALEGAYPGDLVYLPPGHRWDPPEVTRALMLAADHVDASPPPSSWASTAALPFPVFEDGDRAPLPMTVGALLFEDPDQTTVRVTLREQSARVPRHWAARMLYRVAVHTMVEPGREASDRPTFGYVETYGGLFYDDHGGGHRLGLRGAEPVEIPSSELPSTLERIYRAIAPEAYRERIEGPV